jgi:hypothetical protein
MFNQETNRSVNVQAEHQATPENEASTDRFFLDENGDVIDRLNPVGGMRYSDGGNLPPDHPPSQFQLRESLLFGRLRVLVSDLFPNSHEGLHTAYSLFQVIRASALNTIEPRRGLQFRFEGTLKRERAHLQDITSLSLFRDDLERLLRDLYGDVDDEMLVDVLRASWEIMKLVLEELWQEYRNAEDFDHFFGAGLLDGYGLTSSDDRLRRAFLDDLRNRVRDVTKDPAKHSRYTVKFAKLFNKSIVTDETEREEMARAV